MTKPLIYKLKLDDCRQILALIDEIDEVELTVQERHLRTKIRRIQRSIENAISRKSCKNEIIILKAE